MRRFAIMLTVMAAAAAAGFFTGRWWSPPEDPPASYETLRDAARNVLGRWWPPPEDPPAVYGGTALFGGERAVPDFALTDHAGGAYTRRDLDETWTLLFFGYTHCPDVCPVTLATMSASVEAITALGGEPPRVVFVSVDPERDAPAHLRSYVTVFRDEFLGVTGSHDQLHRLAKALGVTYARSGDGPDYLVEHSAALLLVNPEGKLQAVFGPPHEPDVIARDVIAIRAYVES